MSLLSAIAAPLGAFGLVVGLIPLLKRGALRAGFVDRPGGRKQHDAPVPPVGGLAVFPVFAGMVLLGRPALADLWCLAALGVLLVAGALDDRYNLPPRTKFAAQWIAALLLTMPGEGHLHALGDLLGFGDLTLGSAGSIMFPAIAAVLLVNAINLMDGLDGLAGGIGLAALFWIVAGGIMAGGGPGVMAPAILIGALSGFLVFNLRHPLRQRATVFLGDAGSLALGLALAWLSIRLAQRGEPGVHPIDIAWILALPIFDTCAQFARRLRQGRHPFDADRNHFHHHFLKVGFSPRRSAAAIAGLSFLLGGIGFAGTRLGAPDWAMAYGWAGLLLLHMYLSLRPRRFRRLLMAFRRPKGGAALS